MDKKPKNYRKKCDLSGFRLLVGMETGRSLACSAGVFFERAICSRKRGVETSRREEEIGRVALAPTVRVTTSTLPNLPLS